MVDKVNNNASYSGTVEKYIGTAFDTVKVVADNIDSVEKLAAIPDLNALAQSISDDASSVADNAQSARDSEAAAGDSADVATDAVDQLTNKAELAGDGTQSFSTADLSVAGGIVVSGTVDGRNVAADGSILDAIETAATADQTAIEVPYVPQGTLSSLNVQSAIDELDTFKPDAGLVVLNSDISEDEGILRKTGVGTYEAIKSNLTSPLDPGTDSSFAYGYAIGSVWVNTSAGNQKYWNCVGDDVWVEGGSVGGAISTISGGNNVTITGTAANPIINADNNFISNNSDDTTTGNISINKSTPTLNLQPLDDDTENTVVRFSDQNGAGRAYLYRPANVNYVRLDARDDVGDIGGIIQIHESGQINLSGQLQLNDVDVTSTAAEINVLNGTTVPSSLNVDGNDGIIMTVDGVTVSNDVATLDSYFSSTFQTLVNKTLTSPNLTNPSIGDANGNEALKIGTTASAVNEVTVTNAATGGSPKIEATGTDTNIDLDLEAKGSGSVNVRSTPVYGLVILDTPINVLDESNSGQQLTTLWADFTDSVLSTAGATKVILRTRLQGGVASAGVRLAVALDVAGTTANTDINIIAKIDTDITSFVHNSFATNTINLDASFEFAIGYRVENNATSNRVVLVEIVGYYV